YLTGFVKNKVLINSLEEGKTKSFQMNIERSGINAVADKVLFGDRVPMEKLFEKLRKQRSPEIIMIDSVQYSKMNKKSFDNLREEFRNKLWIFISQADKSGDPKGSLAIDIRFDADVKIKVEGFKAFPESRFGGGEEFIIDPERAAKYHGQIK
ncbi:MAG TPA: ATP-dependent serine protease, partial [Chryseobacterium sp.]|nr:ATP-dependent serine protease [Chryseobacterium sp.]